MKTRRSAASFIKLPRTIRWRILALFGFGAILLFLAVFFTSQFGLPFSIYQGNYQRLKIEAMERLNFIADSEKTLISMWTNERLADLKFSAQNPHFQAHLHELTATKLQKKKVEPVLDELSEWFQLARKSYHYETVELVDPGTGVCLLSSKEEHTGVRSMLFDELFADGTDWEEKVFFHKTDSGSSICLARQIHAPVAKGSAGTEDLVMLYQVKTEQFITEVLRHSDVLGQSGEIVLIDLNQKLLTPLKYKLPDGTVARPLEYRMKTKPAEFAGWGIDGIQNALDYRGVPVVAVTRNIRVIPDFGLGIIVKQDEAEIFSSLKSSIIYTTSITVSGLTLLLTLLYIVTRNLLKPLERLSSSVTRIKQGDLSARAEAGGGDETGMLSAAFNEMADEIQRWHRGLEVAVQGRTAELRKFAEVVEQSPLSIIITDIQGDIEFVNPKFSELTGYRVEEVLGQNPRILKSDETLPATYKELWVTISSGHIWEGDLANRKKSGEIFWEHAKISPIKNSQGGITGYVGIKEDITERKLMEANLLHSQKMEAMGTLAGGIAHDFNNILTVISGYGTILKMKLGEDTTAVAMIDEILMAEARAEEMTRSLLMFSRKEEIRLVPVNLAEIIGGLQKSLSRLIREDIEFKIELPEGNLPVMADKGQLEQLIINLAVNARDAMPSGGVLSISVADKSLIEKEMLADDLPVQGRYAVITVSDTGMGMDKETQERIFDPFFTTKEVGKGTGLGLSMVYSTAKKHGGSIYFLSEQGEGTTFKIYLPLLEQRYESSAPLDAVPFLFGNETLLLVEDDVAIRKIMTTMLTKQGYTLLTAENGEEGEELFRKNRDKISLVISDVIMPKKNGWEMYQEICRIRPDSPVIFMSGYTADILNKDEISRYHLLLKPINPETLLSKIREILDGKSPDAIQSNPHTI